jgi:hypothetical protein
MNRGAEPGPSRRPPPRRHRGAWGPAGPAGCWSACWAWRRQRRLVAGLGRGLGPDPAIRAPRTLGALAAGALLGLAGALAQGLFRNPLADPYLLGSAAGAGLGVVLVLAGSVLAAHLAWPAAGLADAPGLVGAAFVGALGGVALTLLLARGAGAAAGAAAVGVVVGVLLGAVADLVMLMASPEALRGKQMFLLGTTGFLGWTAWPVLAARWPGAAAGAALARALDALVLGDASAASLGLPLPRVRLLLVALMALATGAAVSQAGLVALSAWWRRTWCAAWSPSRTGRCWRCRRWPARAAGGGRRGRAQRDRAAGAAGGRADGGVRRRLPAGAAARQGGA